MSVMNLGQVAKRLGVSERTVMRLVEDKELVGFKVGHSWRFEPEDVEEYIRQQKERSRQATSEEV